jgi:hypothetical protein
MQKWEYIVMQVGYSSNEGGGLVKLINGQINQTWGKNKIPIYDVLNSLGQEGWELVGIEMRKELTESWKDPLYIMKRPV